MPNWAPWPLLANWKAAWVLVGVGPVHATALHSECRGPPTLSRVLRICSEVTSARIVRACVGEIGVHEPAVVREAATGEAPPSVAAAATAAAAASNAHLRPRLPTGDPIRGRNRRSVILPPFSLDARPLCRSRPANASGPTRAAVRTGSRARRAASRTTSAVPSNWQRTTSSSRSRIEPRYSTAVPRILSSAADGSDSSVERLDVGVRDAGPEALGNEASTLQRVHAVDARPGDNAAKGGKTLRTGVRRLLVERSRELCPRRDPELAVDTGEIRLDRLPRHKRALARSPGWSTRRRRARQSLVPSPSASQEPSAS